MTDHGVVDADGHVVEPSSAWAAVPEEHRPRITADRHGYEHVVVGDTEILAVPLGTLATPGARFSDPAAFRPLEEAWPGESDPVARLADMDSEGIDRAVLYPSVGLYVWAVPDPSAAVAIARAYNDWLSSYCAADRARLFGAAMIPVQDPVAAVAELRRAHDELGFPAAFLRPNPCRGRTLVPPRLRTALGGGRGHGGHHRNPRGEFGHHSHPRLRPALQPPRPPRRLPFLRADAGLRRAHRLRCPRPPSRTPVVFLESGGGWVPFWMERLDEQAEGFGAFCPEMTLAPSEYFARQCWISFEIEEQTLPALAPLIGIDRIVWGSDYPHHDATFPGAVTTLRKTLAPLDESSRDRVLGANAAQLYRLPPDPGLTMAGGNRAGGTMLGAIVAEAASRYGDTPAYVTPDGTSLSYAELHRFSDALAGGLRARGVGPGDLVGLLLPSGPGYAVAYAAAAKIGAVTAGVNDKLSPPERRACLRIARPRLVLASAELAATTALDPLTGQTEVVEVDPAAPASDWLAGRGEPDRRPCPIWRPIPTGPWPWSSPRGRPGNRRVPSSARGSSTPSARPTGAGAGATGAGAWPRPPSPTWAT